MRCALENRGRELEEPASSLERTLWGLADMAMKAVFPNPNANYSNLRAALFHSTPVLDRRRGTHWKTVSIFLCMYSVVVFFICFLFVFVDFGLISVYLKSTLDLLRRHNFCSDAEKMGGKYKGLKSRVIYVVY